MIHTGGGNFWSCGYKYLSPNYMAVISQSTDAGATWTRHTVYSGSTYGYVRAIAADPSDGNRVYGAGYKNSASTLFRTEDGGANWTESAMTGFSGTPYDMLVHPTDQSRIAIASSSGLYASDDGGSSWARVTTAFSTSYSLYQSDVVDGLVISTSSGVWMWEDWTGDPVYFGEDPGVPAVKCVVDVAGEFLFAGTTGASVWRSYCGTSTWENESSPVDSPLALSVSPNPVSSGQAAISFSLPVSSETEITVYDMAGRAVQTVCSGELNAGNHQIQFMTHGLAPGVYFTRIQGGSISESSRFVISK